MDAVLAVAPDAECRDGASIRTPLPSRSRCGPGDFLQPRNDEKRPGRRVGRVLRTVSAVERESRFRRLSAMKVSPSTIEDNLYPFIFCKLPCQVLKQVGPVRRHHDEIPRPVPCRLGFHQGELSHPPGSMPPDMPSHDRAGRHATAPLSPGEFSSAFSRKPRQPNRVAQFHPRTRQPSRGNRNPPRGKPLPNLNGHGAHHPCPVGVARTVPTLCRDGPFRNGEYNSSSLLISPPRGSQGALDRGNWPASPRKGIRHLFLMYMMRFHATLCGTCAVVGSRQARPSTVNRTDTPPTARHGATGVQDGYNWGKPGRN